VTARFAIDGREIGPGHPPYVIAELSGNHNGDIKRALALIDAAKMAGADAVKLQTYTADTLTIDHGGSQFLIEGGLWHGRRLYELYQEAHTPWYWHQPLFDHARRIGITIFSSAFDESAVRFLEGLDVPAYKIASFEAVDLPLLRVIAKTGKPVIISTGITDLAEIAEAVTALREAGCQQLALLHCVSAYPSPAEDMNIRTIPHLAETFDVVSGLSDHTMGTAVSVSAIAQGASIVEKHMTLRRADGGPDSAFSLEPEEMVRLVEDCRLAYAALGHVSYEREPSERGNVVFRRSLYVVSDVAAGEPLTEGSVRSIRPGYGLAPKHMPAVLGRRAKCAIARGTPLNWNLIE
jgi:N-acetylneuraminate synthase